MTIVPQTLGFSRKQRTATQEVTYPPKKSYETFPKNFATFKTLPQIEVDPRSHNLQNEISLPSSASLKEKVVSSLQHIWLGGLGPQLEKSLPSGSADKAARPLVVITLPSGSEAPRVGMHLRPPPLCQLPSSSHNTPPLSPPSWPSPSHRKDHLRESRSCSSRRAMPCRKF